MRLIAQSTITSPVYFDLFRDPLFPETGNQLCVAASDEGIVAVRLGRPSEIASHWQLAPKKVSTYVSMLKDYLAGEYVSWEDITIFATGTEFQLAVWQHIAAIAYGKTISYTELASRSGNKSAVRAAASACGANPIPLIVPCHRIVASDGTLGGFAWGLPYKGKLLELEQRRAHLKAA